MMMLSWPARQNPRTSRSMASSLPRPTRTEFGSDVIECGEAFHEFARLRLRISIQTGRGFVGERAPGQLVGMQALELGFPDGVLVRFQGDDVRLARVALPSSRRRSSARSGPGIRGLARAVQHIQPTGYRAGVSIEPLEHCQLNGNGAQATAGPLGESSCTVMPLTKSSTDRPL